MIPPTGQGTAETHHSPATDIEPHHPRSLLPVIRSSRPTLALVPQADLSSKEQDRNQRFARCFFRNSPSRVDCIAMKDPNIEDYDSAIFSPVTRDWYGSSDFYYVGYWSAST